MSGQISGRGELAVDAAHQLGGSSSGLVLPFGRRLRPLIGFP